MIIRVLPSQALLFLLSPQLLATTNPCYETDSILLAVKGEYETSMMVAERTRVTRVSRLGIENSGGLNIVLLIPF